jgi:hypothetical protein
MLKYSIKNLQLFEEICRCRLEYSFVVEGWSVSHSRVAVAEAWGLFGNPEEMENVHHWKPLAED